MAAEDTQARDLPHPLDGTQNKNKALEWTGSANTNQNDSTNNPTVSGSPEDREDTRLNIERKKKKKSF